MTQAQQVYLERVEAGTVEAEDWSPCVTCGEWVFSEFNSTQSELGWEHDACTRARLTPLWDETPVNESIGDNLGEFSDFIGILVAIGVMALWMWCL